MPLYSFNVRDGQALGAPLTMELLDDSRAITFAKVLADLYWHAGSHSEPDIRVIVTNASGDDIHSAFVSRAIAPPP